MSDTEARSHGTANLILVVEDEPTQRLITQKMIVAGKVARQCLAVASLAECKDFLSTRTPDLILLDLQLPDTEGLTALSEIAGQNPTIPIVVLTNAEDDRMALEAIRLGAQDYIVKGAETETVKRSIRYSIERKNAELQLHSSRLEVQQLSLKQDAIIRSLHQGIAVITADWMVVWGNERLLELLGKRERLDSFPAFRLASIVADDAEGMRIEGRAHAGILLVGHYREDIRLLGSHGPFWGELTIVRVNPRESGAGFVASISDITDRRLQEEALSRERAILNGIIDINPYSLMITDASGRPIRTNEAYDKLFGGSPAHDYTLFTDPILAKAAILGELGRARRGDAISFDSIWWANPSQPDHEICLGGVVFPLCNDDDHIMNYVVMHVDKTAEKLAEKNLRLREEDLHQSQKMEAIGVLAGGVAHDFSNILTIIQGYACVCMAKTDEGLAMYDKLSKILRAVKRASALTGQLLAFSRKQTMQLRIVDLNVLVRDNRPMWSRLVPERVMIDHDLTTEPIRVQVDPSRLEQVFLNLLVNARDAMPEGGSLLVRTGSVEVSGKEAGWPSSLPPGTYATVSFEDTGLGMSPEVISRIFEPFYTTKPTGQGTGLGLSTVFGIIRQSGGHISVASTVGKGTAFTIHLPDQSGEPIIEADPPVQLPKTRRRAMILVAEDQDDVRDLATSLLRDAGHRVMAANGAGEALMLAETAPGNGIDLLVTDVVMPGKSGPEIVRLLRETRPSLPVLYITGHADEELALHKMGDAKDPILMKPFSPAELLAKVDSVLG